MKKSSKVLLVALLVLIAAIFAVKLIHGYQAKQAQKQVPPPVEHTYETDDTDFSNVESEGDS